MNDIPLASLSLTHVNYDPSDPISYLCAWLALAPQALCVIYVTLIWATREIEILLMFVGQLGSGIVNVILKRIIKEERPKQMLGKGYGMPSSHAQFVAFFSVSLALFLLIRHSPLPSPSYSPTTKSQRIILSTLLITYALVVAASRIYLNYHTFNQVLVGYSSGAISAVVWFGITAWARKNGYVDYILNRKEIELLRMRDLVIEEDLAEAGWAHWKKARARRYAEKFNEARKST